MGMDANIIGIGPITQDILTTNGLDKEHYEDVPIGTFIAASFFSCVTTDMSRALARSLRVEPFDFAEHNIDKLRRPRLLEEIDWAEIGHISRNEKTDEDSENEIECFKACYEAGWLLIYQPNF